MSPAARMRQLLGGVPASAFERGALECIEEAGVDVAADIEALRSGRMTHDELIERGLAGADSDDRVSGWYDYARTVARLASATIGYRVRYRVQTVGLASPGWAYLPELYQTRAAASSAALRMTPSTPGGCAAGSWAEVVEVAS